MSTILWDDHIFRLANVTAAVVNLKGDRVLRVERDLGVRPFRADDIANTVDQPTYAALADLEMRDGVIEVSMLSRIQAPSPFGSAQGFIGLAYRIAPDDRAFESIYLRPNVGRSMSQFARNHTVQYFAYPDHPFARLRADAPGHYETWADVGLDEWIKMRIEFQGGRSALYLNDHLRPAFLADPTLGTSGKGSIGLWVDIGTVGYFKDLRVLQMSGPDEGV